jgi:hypothetical protein
MYSRYANRKIFINASKEYKDEFFKDRDLEEMVQYDSPRIGFPDLQAIQGLTSTPIRWDVKSRLFNLASEHYGDPSMWWVIAWYNQKPTEAHFNVGDVVYIPTPLSSVLQYFKG